MVTTTFDSTRFFQRLQLAIREEIKAIEKDEVEKAKERIHERIHQVTDRIAISLLQEYDMKSGGNGIVITVRK